MKIRSEEPATYKQHKEVAYLASGRLMDDDAIISRALEILSLRIKQPESYITSPDTIKQYLTVLLAEQEREHFLAIFLDNRHGIITSETLFQGTIDGSSVHPREVVKAALQHNAAAVIFAHNHPSGYLEPSTADRRITEKLIDALALVDIRVLDHLIIGGAKTTSFAERGLI